MQTQLQLNHRLSTTPIRLGRWIAHPARSAESMTDRPPTNLISLATAQNILTLLAISTAILALTELALS